MTKAPLLVLAAVLATASLLAQAPKSPSCPSQGDAIKPRIQKLNELRARSEEPSDDDYDDTADIEALVAPGDDSQRWQDDTAVEITAYVAEVHDGGPSSANCHSMDSADHDTILELMPGTGVWDPAHGLLAVITPRWRRIMAKNQIDWSPRAIRARFLQKYVSIRGWLLFDSEAASHSANTAGVAGVDVNRATAWEICPVTGVDPSDDSLEQITVLEGPPPYARSNASSPAP
jgi:hypothetical protein